MIASFGRTRTAVGSPAPPLQSPDVTVTPVATAMPMNWPMDLPVAIANLPMERFPQCRVEAGGPPCGTRSIVHALRWRTNCDPGLSLYVINERRALNFDDGAESPTDR